MRAQVTKPFGSGAFGGSASAQQLTGGCGPSQRWVPVSPAQRPRVGAKVSAAESKANAASTALAPAVKTADSDARCKSWVATYNSDRINGLIRDRIDNFLNDVNSDGNIYPQTKVFTMQSYAVPNLQRIPYEQAVQQTFIPCAPTSQYSFGPCWATVWFLLTVDVPAEYKGKEVHLLFDSGCEAMVWAPDEARPLQGFCPTDRKAYMITQNCQESSYKFYVEMACNGMFGNAGDSFWVNTCCIGVFDRELFTFVTKLQIVREFCEIVDSHRARALQALRACNEVVNVFTQGDRSTWAAAEAIVDEFLAKKNGDAAQLCYTIGHCHIDTGWLWPFAETRRKTARSWSAQLRLFELYDDHMFVCSQPQQMYWLQQDYPILFDEIKQAAVQKKFIPDGGAWVEMDTNMPCGEALVRQFVHGIRFTRDRFGITPKVFWLPDSFGYSSQIPQVLNLVGIKYFLTQKLSWNEFNEIPFNSFLWQGLDGSRVLTHFPPADTYNSSGDAHTMASNGADDRDRAITPISLQLYGLGDGGGGPTEKIMARVHLLRDVDGVSKSAPKAPGDFYDELATYADQLNVWCGELYFEKHRGTYTTQALIKRGNRKSELALRNVEILSVFAMRTNAGAYKYPASDLDAMWKNLLLCQFHDVLPGSCITLVANDAHQIHSDLITNSATMSATAFTALCGADVSPASTVLVFNTTGSQRVEVLPLPAGASQFNTTNTQLAADGTRLALLAAPPYGYNVQAQAKDPAGSVTVQTPTTDTFVLENRFVKVTFTSAGIMTGFDDVANGRSVLAPGENGNVLVLYDDHPTSFDAWDVDLQYLQKKTMVPAASSAKVLESGPLRVALQFVYQITSSNSTITQTVYLYAHSPRIDFECTVVWNESHKFLKVEFPVNVFNTIATYETQFGMVQRPTHQNTTWDLAKFEVCAHHWADLSEYGYGVTIMNDCKYGHSIQGHMMRLSLLRSPKDPDPTADMGTHQFKFALFPHAGSIQEAGVVQEAMAFNAPLLTKAVKMPADSVVTFANVSVDSLILNTIKQDENATGAIVLRLYEAYGGRGQANITINSLGLASGSLWKATLTNALEEIDSTATALNVTAGAGDSLVIGPVPFLPFSILTIVLQPQSAGSAHTPAAAPQPQQSTSTPRVGPAAAAAAARLHRTVANVRGGSARYAAAGVPVPAWAK